MDEEEVGEAMHKTQLGQRERERHSINISLADSAQAQRKRTLKEALRSEQPPSSHLHHTED